MNNNNIVQRTPQSNPGHRRSNLARFASVPLLVALTGCTTYVERRTVYSPPQEPVPAPAPPVYVPPPPVVYAEPPPVEPAAAVEIRVESDFYGPLTPYGQWVVIAPYGRCWIPAGVATEWRPYCSGHWVRTERGWFWDSDEPWAWATYHYGRWDWRPEFGWYWVPQVQWAPAWVSWHEADGFIGWAPLHPASRLTPSGVVEVNVNVVSPRAYVFVEERRFLEPVRPTTVVNNTTIINKTVNITNIRVVNKTVINEGPRTEVIEHASRRPVQVVPARDLRHTSEAVVVARHPSPPVVVEKKAPVPTAPPLARQPGPGATPTHVHPEVQKSIVSSPPPQTAPRHVSDTEVRPARPAPAPVVVKRTENVPVVPAKETVHVRPAKPAVTEPAPHPEVVRTERLAELRPKHDSVHKPAQTAPTHRKPTPHEPPAEKHDRN